MFEKFSRSWALVKASASVLKSDKELLVFPLISGIACMVVAASFFLPIALGGFDIGEGGEGPKIWVYPLVFIFYIVQYFIIIFFNSALIGAAMIRLNGGDPTVADGFRIASSKFKVIFGYALIAATVGLALRGMKERAGFLGDMLIGAIGIAWTVASFLVVPVLVSQDIGPIDAVKRSAELLKKTWGENLIGTGGIGVVFGLIMVLSVFLGLGLILAAADSGGWQAAVAVGIVFGVLLLLLILIQAALSGIYSAALYRYATEGAAGQGFDQAIIADAFKVKS